MRVTAATKKETRARILAAAESLFVTRGFAATSTRELARKAAIGVGTLFNYFPTKEEVALALLQVALTRGEEGYRARLRGSESLAEELFAHVAAELRELTPYRAFLSEVIEGALGPFARRERASTGDAIRARHLEIVDAIIERHGATPEGGILGVFSTHLYWTLYLGVLGAWANDDSPRQQDTLVILDRSMNLFARAIRGPDSDAEVFGGH